MRRMLDVSQLQAIDPLREGKHFDICEYAPGADLHGAEDHRPDLDVEADIPEAHSGAGDKDMITQVIYNLLENATKFAREGSTLYLGVTTIDGKARVTVRNEGTPSRQRSCRCCSSGSTRATSPAARTRMVTAWGCTSSRRF